MSRQRKHVPGPEKLAILKRRLVEKTPISDLCDEYRLQPSQIYYWQSQLFEHGAGVFERKPSRQGKQAESAKDRQIAQLEAVLARKEAKLAQKNEVISELMEENVRVKKANGEL
jgi:transposase-like protein